MLDAPESPENDEKPLKGRNQLLMFYIFSLFDVVTMKI